MVGTTLSDATDEHGLYPIRTVAQMTGVNPITLRAWERRYGLIKPVRTEKGHRLYSQRDIAEIRRVLKLLERGIAISQVAPVLEAAPSASSAPHVPAPVPDIEHLPWTHAYRAALSCLDEAGLDRLEADAMALSAPDRILADLVLPMLDALEADRHHDAALDAQYRLLQSRLTISLGQRLRHLPAVPNARRLLVTSLPPERGMFALLHMAWRLRRDGLDSVVMGAGLPVQTVVHMVRGLSIDAVILVVDQKPPAAVLGSQLPVLAEAGVRVLAVGLHAEVLRDSLEPLGILLPATSEGDLLDFIRTMS
ncbi:MAG: MerR family transcriptional regulator [Pseudomonadota bacterium]